MRRTLFVPAVCSLAVICLAVLTVFSSGLAYAQTPAPEGATEEPYIPGRLIVGMDPAADLNATGLQAADALQALDAQVITAADPCVADAALAASAGVQTAVQSWQVLPGHEEEAIALLSAQPGVRFVARDVYMYAAQDEIVDPAAADEADLAPETVYPVNDPLYTSYQWGPQRANFPRAWQLLPVSSTLTAIRVAVIDSGVDFTHPDLAGRLLTGKNYITEGATAQDDNGHGTHVAGIIAAITNNGQGIAGSAPKVLIDPRKVLAADGSGNAINLRYALCDAALNGDRVVNMSLQISPSLKTSNPTLYEAIREAVVFAANRGVLLVAAGGNNRLTPQVYYPALFDEVVAVASLTVGNQRPDYSAIGPKVEIAAPGGDSPNPVLSTWPSAASVRAKCAAPVQSGSGWYCGEYGTSMASPYVAGAGALVLSVQPSLTGSQVRTILRETAVDVGLPADEQGAGLLDAEGAVRRLARSSLQVALTGANRTVDYGSAPYTATLVLTNPSLEPLSVTGLITNSTWLSVPGVSGPTFAGTVAYGQPLAMPVVVSPTHLLTGTYVGSIQLTATRSDGSTIKSTPTVLLGVDAQLPPPLYLPLILQDSSPQTSIVSNATAFSWETPISPTVYALTNTESVDVALPFVFPLSGPTGTPAKTYAQARIYADGFVIFPDAATGTITNPGQNRCLPWSPGGLQGVFGWWANLDAAAGGAEVSSFRPAADRFVIQYKDLASVGVTPAYRVTFQIVLYRSGDVQLNYQQAPEPWTPSFDQLLPLATVGVQASNGLYRNQVACAAPDGTRLGTLPQSGQSLRIKSTEVY